MCDAGYLTTIYIVCYSDRDQPLFVVDLGVELIVVSDEGVGGEWQFGLVEAWMLALHLLVKFVPFFV